MAFLVLVLAAAIACASGQQSLETCSSTYSTNLAKASGAEKCTVLDSFGACLSSVLSVNTDLTAADNVETALLEAFDANPFCDLAVYSQYRPTIKLLNSSVVVSVPQNEDIVINQVERTTIGVSDLISQANGVINGYAPALDEINQSASILANTIDSGANNFQAFLQSQTQAILPVGSQISTISSSVSTSKAALDGSITTINNFHSTIQGAIANEEGALLTWQSMAFDTAASHRLNLQIAVADDAADRASIITEDQNTLVASQYSISSLLAGFLNTESSRAIVKTSATAADLAVLSTSLASDLSAGLSAEIAAANSAAAGFASRVVNRPAIRNGSLDSTVCTSDGDLYFSSARGTWVVCSVVPGGKRYTPLALAGASFIRAGSTILTNGLMDQSILRRLGFRGVWTKCYDTAFDGFSATTFHNKCNNKGSTLTLARTSTSRIFGGYMNYAWTSRQGYITSAVSFIFRMNGNVADVAYNYQYPSNAVNTVAAYDHSSYCPTFGGINDMVMSNPCQTVSFSSAYYYNNNGYSSSWMTGTTSNTVNKIEVYFRNF